MNKAIYLKINRKEEFAFRNLSRWVDAAYLMNRDCFIICDSEEIRQKIQEEILLSKYCSFITSDKSEINSKIVKNIANGTWENAALAHITTFSDAIRHKCDFFWNIDADDTFLCLSIDRMVELLQQVEDYVEQNGIDCFSLDMWRSKWEGKHWSFGITYTSCRLDWYRIFIEHCEDVNYRNLENEMNYNIDCFFTYLKDISEAKIGTFYFENLKFIHYSNDFFKGLISSAFYHWKDNKLYYPIMQVCVGMDELGVFDIYQDVHKFDMYIEDDEAKNVLTYYSKEGKEFTGKVNWNELTNKVLFQKKTELYMSRYKNVSEVICFGTGNCFENNYEKIKAIARLRYVCDNDSNKWGRVFMDDIYCISPVELIKKKGILVIITIYSPKVAQVIKEQLLGLGISNIDFIHNFLKCIE